MSRETHTPEPEEQTTASRSTPASTITRPVQSSDGGSKTSGSVEEAVEPQAEREPGPYGGDGTPSPPLASQSSPLDGPAASPSPVLPPTSLPFVPTASDSPARSDTPSEMTTLLAAPSTSLAVPTLTSSPAPISSRSTTPLPPKKFSSLNVNKKFLEKSNGPAGSAANATSATATGATASTIGAKKLVGSTGTTLSKTSVPPPPAKPPSRLLTTRLVHPTPVQAAPSPPPTGWNRPTPSPSGTPSLPPSKQPSGTHPPLSSGGQLGGRVGMAGVMTGGSWFRNSSPSASNLMRGDLGGARGDFPTTAESAEGRLNAQANAQVVKQAEAAHQLARLQELDAFRGVHKNPGGHHWDDVDDENDDFLDEVVEFGDGTQYKVTHEESIAAAAAEEATAGLTFLSSTGRHDRLGEDFDRSWPQSHSEQHPPYHHAPSRPQQRPFQPSHPHPHPSSSSHRPEPHSGSLPKSYPLDRQPSSHDTTHHVPTQHHLPLRQPHQPSNASSSSGLPSKPRSSDDTSSSKLLFNERSNRLEAPASHPHHSQLASAHPSAPPFKLLQKSPGSVSTRSFGRPEGGSERHPPPQIVDRALPPHLAIGASASFASPAAPLPPRNAWSTQRPATRAPLPHLASHQPSMAAESLSSHRPSLPDQSDRFQSHQGPHVPSSAHSNARPPLGAPRRLSNNTTATYQPPLEPPSLSPTLSATSPYSARRASSDASRRLSMEPLVAEAGPRRPSMERPSSPEDLTTMQKEEMVSAAERARKRREAEEAERLAARERAKRKADELAARVKAEKEAIRLPTQTREELAGGITANVAQEGSTSAPPSDMPVASAATSAVPETPSTPSLTSTPQARTTPWPHASSLFPHAGIATPPPPQLRKDEPIPEDVQVVDYANLSSLAIVDPAPVLEEAVPPSPERVKRTRPTALDFFEDDVLQEDSKVGGADTLDPVDNASRRRGKTAGSTNPSLSTSTLAASAASAVPSVHNPLPNLPSSLPAFPPNESSSPNVPSPKIIATASCQRSNVRSASSPALESPSDLSLPRPPPSPPKKIGTGGSVGGGHREVGISSIDDVMFRIKSQIESRKLEEAAAAAAPDPARTTYPSSKPVSPSLPAKPQFSSLINPFAPSQLLPSVPTPASSLPFRRPAPMTHEEPTTVSPRPITPPPAWKLYTVNLPSDLRRRLPVEASTLRVAERGFDALKAPEVFSWGKGKGGSELLVVEGEARVQLSRTGVVRPAAAMTSVPSSSPSSFTLPTKPPPSKPSPISSAFSLISSTSALAPAKPSSSSLPKAPSSLLPNPNNSLPLPPRPVPSLAVIAATPTKSARVGRAMEEVSWRRKGPLTPVGEVIAKEVDQMGQRAGEEAGKRSGEEVEANAVERETGSNLEAKQEIAKAVQSATSTLPAELEASINFRDRTPSVSSTTAGTSEQLASVVRFMVSSEMDNFGVEELGPKAIENSVEVEADSGGGGADVLEFASIMRTPSTVGLEDDDTRSRTETSSTPHHRTISSASSLVLSPPSAATSSAWSKTPLASSISSSGRGGPFDDQSAKSVWGQSPSASIGVGTSYNSTYSPDGTSYHPSRQNSFGSSYSSSHRSNYVPSQPNSAFSSPYNNARPNALPHSNNPSPYPSPYHHPSGLHPTAPPFPNPYTNPSQAGGNARRPPSVYSPAHNRSSSSITSQPYTNMSPTLGSPASSPTLNPTNQPFASPQQPGARKPYLQPQPHPLNHSSPPLPLPASSMMPPLPVGIPQAGGVWLPVNVSPVPSAPSRPLTGFAGSPHHSPFNHVPPPLPMAAGPAQQHHPYPFAQPSGNPTGMFSNGSRGPLDSRGGSSGGGYAATGGTTYGKRGPW